MLVLPSELREVSLGDAGNFAEPALERRGDASPP